MWWGRQYMMGSWGQYSAMHGCTGPWEPALQARRAGERHGIGRAGQGSTGQYSRAAGHAAVAGMHAHHVAVVEFVGLLRQGLVNWPVATPAHSRHRKCVPLNGIWKPSVTMCLLPCICCCHDVDACHTQQAQMPGAQGYEHHLLQVRKGQEAASIVGCMRHRP